MGFASFNPTVSITHSAAASNRESTANLTHGKLKEFPQLFDYGTGVAIFLSVQWHTEGFKHEIK